MDRSKMYGWKSTDVVKKLEDKRKAHLLYRTSSSGKCTECFNPGVRSSSADRLVGVERGCPVDFLTCSGGRTASKIQSRLGQMGACQKFAKI